MEKETNNTTTATPNNESSNNATSATKDRSTICILVAEDNDSNYKLVEILLRGYRLERAINGKEAVQMAKDKTYSMIFMDIKMPFMDGVEATQCIREFDKEIPIVALTANAFDDDKRRAYDAGVNGFLTKPLSKNVLIETVEEYCM